VSLTPEGRRVFRAMARVHEGWIAGIFSQLLPADVDALMRLLARTKASAREAITGEPPR
jgi:DNA-binding MarR family transcriptional regulator